MIFRNNFFFKIVLFKINFFFKNVLSENFFFFKIWRIVNFLIQKSHAYQKIEFRIWQVVKISIQNLTRCKNFSPKSVFCLAFPVLTEWWFLLSTLTPTSLIEENWKTIRVIVSRQMDNWKLPNINSSLNVWVIALLQHAILTEVREITLWNIKCSRSAVFPIKHLCGNKRKRPLLETKSESSISSITSPKSREICRLRCKFLCSIVGWSKLSCSNLP